MAGLFENLISGGIEGAGILDAINRTETLGETARSELSASGARAANRTRFRPFTVASSTGNVNVAEDGGITSVLSPEMMDTSAAARSAASGLLGNNFDIAGRTNEIFDAMQAATQPEFDRQLTSLGSGLFSRGRTGIASNQFGTTPEEFAIRKAREEALANAFLTARGQANQERATDVTTGRALLDASFVPEATLFNQLNTGINTANLAQTGQIAGSNLQTQLDTAGIQTQLNSQKLVNDLYAGLFGVGANLGGQLGQVLDESDFGSSVADFLGDLF